ncbi:hypothetical protein WKR88_18625 [Trinickia caryophylli]|uniref:hypothetical protein n=1 Tax=Trinickia caryophylli TaxID=28094 RepID=UPI000A16B07B|nr:hypothetical protein [Trinickia caryophylli]TRX17007.1 hypothetical protein FNF07_01365 [Trinickia caryophylli]WQE12253.1 hypothetical protein U0034_02185 [Trinickia caryophylli]
MNHFSISCLLVFFLRILTRGGATRTLKSILCAGVPKPRAIHYSRRSLLFIGAYAGRENGVCLLRAQGPLALTAESGYPYDFDESRSQMMVTDSLGERLKASAR